MVSCLTNLCHNSLIQMATLFLVKHTTFFGALSPSPRFESHRQTQWPGNGHRVLVQSHRERIAAAIWTKKKLQYHSYRHCEVGDGRKKNHLEIALSFSFEIRPSDAIRICNCVIRLPFLLAEFIFNAKYTFGQMFCHTKATLNVYTFSIRL